MRRRGTCWSRSRTAAPPRSSYSSTPVAIPLRDAVAEAGGYRIDDGFINPLDLVALGMVSAEESKRLHDLETASAQAS
jgi:hypothetical protein